MPNPNNNVSINPREMSFSLKPYIAVPDNTPNHNIGLQFEIEADRIAFQKLVTQLAIDNDCRIYVGDNGIELEDKDGNPIDLANLSPEAQKQFRQANRIFDRSEPDNLPNRVTTTDAFQDYAR